MKTNIFDTNYLQSIYKDINNPLENRIKALILDTALFYRNPDNVASIAGVCQYYLPNKNKPKKCAVGRLLTTEDAKRLQKSGLGTMVAINNLTFDNKIEAHIHMNNKKAAKILSKQPEWLLTMPLVVLGVIQEFHDNIKSMGYEACLKTLHKKRAIILGRNLTTEPTIKSFYKERGYIQ